MAGSALFYFIGENAHALRGEKRAWKRQFVEKHGPENLTELDATSVKFRVLLDEVSTAPFIAQKRLVVIEGTPTFTKEEVERLPDAMHPDCILVIADVKPDKRLQGTKALLKIATVKEFPLLRGAALPRWIGEEAKRRGTAFAAGASEALLAVAGEDQDVLSQELTKLALFAGSRPVTKEDVAALCVPSGEQEVWELTRLLAEGKRTEALRYAREMTERGEDPFALWNVLLWTLKNLGIVAAAVEEGERQPAKIASQYKVPFPTARNLLSIATRLPRERLRAIITWAADTDVQLKTGGYRSTREAPQELEALIDRFVLLCTESV
jgi:DNA polymerase-3 subunit delta